MDVNLQMVLTSPKAWTMAQADPPLSVLPLLLPGKVWTSLLKLGTPLTYFLIPASPRLEKTKAYIRITDSFPTPTLTPYPHCVLPSSVETTVEWWQPRRQCLGMLGVISPGGSAWAG